MDNPTSESSGELNTETASSAFAALLSPEPVKEPEKEPEADKEVLPETPKEDRKRSIYDEYKDKKSELKSEKELREAAERERDEWKRIAIAAQKQPE